MQTVGILGVGEVGSAIKTLCRSKFKVLTRDLDHDHLAGCKIDILHICIPYSGKFLSVVTKAVRELKPKLVIINSTVKPGITRAVYKKTQIPIAHVPIMGVHPKLASYQKVFTKMIGAVNDRAYKLARAHWKKLGAKKMVRFDGPEETELGKILSTTYYGWNIVFNQLAKIICDKEKVNFDQVYTQFNQIYNQGYAKAKPNVRRPILNYVPGPIGGHCVIPNAQILENFSPTTITKTLLSFNKYLENEAKDKKK